MQNEKSPTLPFVVLIAACIAFATLFFTGDSKAKGGDLTLDRSAEFVAVCRADLIFEEVSIVDESVDPNPPSECPCNGTKRSGDGLGPCQCGPGCTCPRTSEPMIEEPPAAEAKEPALIDGKFHIVVGTSPNCIHCKRWFNTEYAKLKDKYKIGHVNFKDGDAALPLFWVAGTRHPIVGFTSAEVLESLLKTPQ
jgi:hypothetical protein